MIGLLAALLLLNPFASADAIRFTPPNPTTHTSIDAIATGTWPDGCVPQPASVSVSGSTITLHLVAGSVCPAIITSYSTVFHLDLLPAGEYTVVTVDDVRSKELARQTLVVREADTFVLRPYAVPVTGGKFSIVNTSNTAVKVGGVSAPAVLQSDGGVLVDAPPHVAGPADVTVGSVTAKAALIYYDPTAADPAVFEPLLFPVSFEGPGAAGSQWTTENVVELGAHSFFRDPVANGRLANDSKPWGRVFYAVRGTIEDASFNSRVRDLSRQAQSAGTEVPVVREREFRARPLRFLNIPNDGRSRLTLRVWSLDDAPILFNTDTSPISFPLPLIPMTRIDGTTMFFGSVDVTARLPQGTPNGIVFAATSPTPAPRLWGMISITNNETQQVTLVTPQ